MANAIYQTKMAENADLLALLADLKKDKEEMKSQIQAYVESRRNSRPCQRCIEKIEDVQGVKREIGEVKGKVQRKIEEVKRKSKKKRVKFKG
ncbi:hypothetical protein AVEN_180810-1 [Araneus ventricosus]|uniref:Uncharacterized protein n=1 Tax=Araneus ventricosus TaxID=182803 RepID=A0A4Y2DN62_ARAVE|nr:hypothetical protein AVEN_180810-1 [Araneus ventricosus]